MGFSIRQELGRVIFLFLFFRWPHILFRLDTCCYTFLFSFVLCTFGFCVHKSNIFDGKCCFLFANTETHTGEGFGISKCMNGSYGFGGRRVACNNSDENFSVALFSNCFVSVWMCVDTVRWMKE